MQFAFAIDLFLLILIIHPFTVDFLIYSQSFEYSQTPQYRRSRDWRKNGSVPKSASHIVQNKQEYICASLGSRMKFKTLCYPVFGRNKNTALPSF